MLFDGVVTAYRYGIHPPALMCTLSLARATIYHQIPNGRLSLKNVLNHLGLGVKGDFINQMVGMHWSDLLADPGLMMLFSAYAINDVQGVPRDILSTAPILPQHGSYRHGSRHPDGDPTHTADRPDGA